MTKGKFVHLMGTELLAPDLLTIGAAYIFMIYGHTGACIFAPFDSQKAAEDVKSRVPRQWQSFVARGMNRNPVHTRCRILENSD